MSGCSSPAATSGHDFGEKVGGKLGAGIGKGVGSVLHATGKTLEFIVKPFTKESPQ